MLPTPSHLQQVRALLQQYGLWRCAYRVQYDFRRRAGWLKVRFPAWAWDDRPLGDWLKSGVPAEPGAYVEYRNRDPRSRVFFFPLGKPPTGVGFPSAHVVSVAEALEENRFLYFGHTFGRLGQDEPDWFLSPFSGVRDGRRVHWCDLSDFDAGRGDIKLLWEPSRCTWVYALARAFGRTGDSRFPATFWRLVESWVAANPPEIGVHWLCGQEISIRVLALILGLHAFWNCPATTPDRVARLVVLLAASAQRVARNIHYARIQMGNHATSEAAALYTVGLLFPELRAAERWKRLGRAVLEDEARQSNWTDGSYTQHSVNYQRLMLETYTWCLGLAQRHGERFSDLLHARLQASYRFLYQLQDDTDGRLPNYGANDGAHLLPLSECDYLDYRPTLGALHFWYEQTLLYGSGPWEENLVWLYGDSARERPREKRPRTSQRFGVGGYDTLRGKETWGFVRCHSYRTRPSQADMLHLDLWWRGLNLLRDSGSGTYYDPQGRWHEYFMSTAAHNTVAVGGEDQMVKGPRFRWFTLAGSRFLGRWQSGDCELWQGEHHGYRRRPTNVIHRRTVCRLSETAWVVVDDVLGSGQESLEVLWQLAPGAWALEGDTVRWSTPVGEVVLMVAAEVSHTSEVANGQEKPRRLGWRSLYYGERTPAPTFRMSARAELPCRFVSVLCLERVEALQCRGDVVAWAEVRGEGITEIRLGPVGTVGPAVVEWHRPRRQPWRPALNNGVRPGIGDGPC